MATCDPGDRESPLLVARWLISAKLTLAFICCMLGTVLLIAGKSAAGVALVVASLVLVFPLGYLIESTQLSKFLKVGFVVVLSAFAITSVANTDIPREQEITGYIFIDQIMAIYQRFQESLFGTNQGKLQSTSGALILRLESAAHRRTTEISRPSRHYTTRRSIAAAASNLN